MDGTAEDWNPHARRVWEAYYSTDRSECPPAPYMAPRGLPDLTPPFSPDRPYDIPVECALNPVLTEGHLIYCSTDAASSGARGCWVCDAPSDAAQLDEDRMEQDATYPLMHVMNLRFDDRPPAWDVQLSIRRLERGATVKAVLFAIDLALRKPHEDDPTTRRVDVLRAISSSERWRVRLRSNGDDEFSVILT
ncbi:hypothetical protein AURDEDRAFT_182346 [Auricularia subglabra TFB-10046 SS5]|nr:hypothetical protein AURDEDRAFT_182346 [Auricularia subglabra TFB-10046 SS5]